MQKDWLKFYKDKTAPQEPSSFAQFFMHLNLPGRKCVDLGSGNGRDTYLLGKRYETIGIDPNAEPEPRGRASFERFTWKAADLDIEEADIVYSRFFLHAISKKETEEILDLTKSYFCAEARAVGDKPKLYPEHDRNFVDGDALLVMLLAKGFEIKYYAKGQGLAPYKNEDPLVVRVIAKRK